MTVYHCLHYNLYSGTVRMTESEFHHLRQHLFSKYLTSEAHLIAFYFISTKSKVTLRTTQCTIRTKWHLALIIKHRYYGILVGENLITIQLASLKIFYSVFCRQMTVYAFVFPSKTVLPFTFSKKKTQPNMSQGQETTMGKKKKIAKIYRIRNARVFQSQLLQCG